MDRKENILEDIYEKRKRRHRLAILSAVILTTSIILGACAFIVLRSPFFQIKDIEITGQETLAADEILPVVEAKILDNSLWRKIFGYKNILVWPKEFSKDDLKLLPLIKNLTIEKNFSERKIILKVDERKPFGIWCFIKTQINADNTQINADTNNGDIGVNQRTNPRESASDCWWFDGEGTIFKKSLAAEGNLITVANDYSQSNPGLGSRILPDEFIPAIFSIFGVLQQSNLSIKEIRLNDLSLQEIEVDTYEGPKLYFSLRFPSDNDLDVIQNLKQNPMFLKLEYLDFRTENRAYYK